MSISSDSNAWCLVLLAEHVYCASAYWLDNEERLVHADAAAQRRAKLPSVAVAVPSRRLAQPIPTMERRDRSSLGRLVMPEPDTSGSAVASQTAAKAQSGHSRANEGAHRGPDVSKERHEARLPAASGSAAVPHPAASQRSSKADLGIRPVIVKRTSNSRKAQLALKHRRLDHKVKLVLSEPIAKK